MSIEAANRKTQEENQMSKRDKSCIELVREACESRLEDIRALWELYKQDSEAYHEDLGNWSEYGLAFDYVAPETFGEDQEQGYFRYQISYGGPSEEIRFFTDENFRAYKIEFWYLDWFDGAKKILQGQDKELLQEIFADFKDCGMVEHVHRQAMSKV